MSHKRTSIGNVVRSALLFLFVTGCAIQLGASLYSSQVTEALWASNPPDSLRQWGSLIELAGTNFFRIATPAVGLLALLTLLTSFGTARPHLWWRITSSVIFIAVVVWSVIYFVPTAIQLSGPGLESLSAVEAVQMTESWVQHDVARELLILASFVCGMRALFLSSHTQAAPE